MHEAEHPIVIPIDLWGMHNLINAWTVSLLAFALLFLLMALAKKSSKLIPTGAQNFVEMCIEFVEGMARPLVGRHTDYFLPLFFTLFFYIFFANLLGLVPGLISPTSRVDTNLSLALVVFFSTHVFGITHKGLKGYLAHFLPPALPLPSNFGMKILMLAIQGFMMVLMPVLHIIGELARPLSLTMRLFGNIMAKEKLLAVLVLLIVLFWPISAFTKGLAVVPFVLRSLIVVLGIFVSFVQALVFMLLAMVYIGGAVQEHGHDDHEEHAAAH